MTELLVLLVPSEVHDDMVDALMSLPAVAGFTVAAVSGFSREHSRLSLAEQVEGSRRISRFEVLHDPALRPTLLAALAPVAGRDRLRYWVQPVLESGHIGGDPLTPPLE
ncbi:MAG TPA: DUF3240 domain-containing protein [Halieaceae bacterium]|uniref:DUF3240 family protein n=1 Tax=Haliea TaxID=475794 RepID=UPI000C52DBC9|nr:DUF3240 family protein [Haliea sp.]HAN68616.1 DUF3240 domain-containing protein [Halieaceae bacterium]MAD63648.1 hypothetical protein [Haliea sp.]MAY92009.1 hypothetical protein [Haliea sp.]MBK41933.1 hypothetical protein [Haliea sp.]MBP70059.1 hypothetical protein [Haliea sp.]